MGMSLDSRNHPRRGSAVARFVAVALLGVAWAGAQGCASGTALTREQVIEQVDSVAALSAQLNSAKESGLDMLAPQGFASAQSALDEAIASARDGSTADAERISKEGLARLQRARTDSRNSASTLREVLERRQRALAAGAPTLLPEQFAKLDKELRQASQLAERGDLEGAKDATPALLRGYSTLELDALKSDATDLARNAIEAARKAEAEQYSPDTFTRATSELKLAEGILDTDRSQVDQANVHARRASELASRSQYLSELVQEFERREYDREAVLLWYQEQLEKLTAALDPPISFSQPNYEAIADARQRIEAAVNGRREAEAQLAEARAASTELGGDLQRVQEAQRIAEARYDRVSSMFSEEEALVFRRGNDVVLTTYGFDFPVGESEIRSNNFGLLNKIARAISEFESPRIVVSGHTDATGSNESNQKLSEARAQKVGAFFVEVGELSPNDVETEGFGESKPVATNETSEGRARNRRIEILIVNSDAGVPGSSVPAVSAGPPSE